MHSRAWYGQLTRKGQNLALRLVGGIRTREVESILLVEQGEEMGAGRKKGQLFSVEH